MFTKILKYQNLESIGTIGWLLMDFTWMCGYTDLAIYIAILPFITLASAFIFYDGDKKSERVGLLASWLWFFMNGFWVLSDKNPDWLVMAKLMFIMSSISIIVIIFLSRKEKSTPDIKRLNIK